MNEAVLFKELERQTLARDKQLKKLKELASRLNNNEVDYEVVKDYVGRVSKSRETLMKRLKKLNEIEFTEAFIEPVTALLSFTVLVAVNVEEEALIEIKNYALSKGLSEDVEYFNNELSNVKSLSDEAEKILNKINVMRKH
ncbi:MAG: hypothetical protein B7O98_02575 [Zestosphaera tikiterensis]|uniref:Uncharacterized protein n=1 Tax=Zestosphaera tikiterensis TaxID=1973259 RepID=A0A2R7Y8Z1_9CREN|nr:MAG: hypothetical protein B7O98_02575 [Zestosphaera tikiterensis]